MPCIHSQQQIKELKKSEDTVSSIIERMDLENKEDKKTSLSSSAELEDKVKTILSLVQDLHVKVMSG